MPAALSEALSTPEIHSVKGSDNSIKDPKSIRRVFYPRKIILLSEEMLPEKRNYEKNNYYMFDFGSWIDFTSSLVHLETFDLFRRIMGYRFEEPI